LQFQYTNEAELEQDSRFTVSTTEENDFAFSTTIETQFCDFGLKTNWKRIITNVMVLWGELWRKKKKKN